MTQTVILRGDSQRDLARSLIAKAPPNAVVRISEEGRTLEQNARMHAMLSDIARARPEGRVLSADIWKGVFLDAIGFKPKWVPNLDGDGMLCLGYRSSQLTKNQMSDMIECMFSFGARTGVQWSEPQEKAA